MRGDDSAHAKMQHQKRDVGRRNAADPAGLGKVSRPNPRELLTSLGPKLEDARVAETIRDALLGESRLAIDLDLLSGDIPGVFLVDFNLLSHQPVDARQFR